MKIKACCDEFCIKISVSNTANLLCTWQEWVNHRWGKVSDVAFATVMCYLGWGVIETPLFYSLSSIFCDRIRSKQFIMHGPYNKWNQKTEEMIAFIWCGDWERCNSRESELSSNLFFLLYFCCSIEKTAEAIVQLSPF